MHRFQARKLCEKHSGFLADIQSNGELEELNRVLNLDEKHLFPYWIKNYEVDQVYGGWCVNTTTEETQSGLCSFLKVKNVSHKSKNFVSYWVYLLFYVDTISLHYQLKIHYRKQTFEFCEHFRWWSVQSQKYYVQCEWISLGILKWATTHHYSSRGYQVVICQIWM